MSSKQTIVNYLNILLGIHDFYNTPPKFRTPVNQHWVKDMEWYCPEGQGFFLLTACKKDIYTHNNIICVAYNLNIIHEFCTGSGTEDYCGLNSQEKEAISEHFMTLLSVLSLAWNDYYSIIKCILVWQYIPK